MKKILLALLLLGLAGNSWGFGTYALTEDTLAIVLYSDIDVVISCARLGDMATLAALIKKGRLVELKKGTKLTELEGGDRRFRLMSYCKVRPEGYTRHLWVAGSDYLSNPVK